MIDRIHEQLAAHVAVSRAMFALEEDIRRAAQLVCDTFRRGGILYTFGNGGSAADAQHFSGELVGHYRRDRRPLPAVTLSTDPTVLTCIANDYDFADVFARQVRALAGGADLVVAFTTSGRSPNVVRALAAARANGAATLLLSGGDGGPAAAHSDLSLLVPAAETARIQEMHTLVLHVISELVDAWAALEDMPVGPDGMPGR